MQKIMWETVFTKQLEDILDSHGIDKTDIAKIDSLKKRLNITRRSSCQLMVEVAENWKDKLVQLLEKENYVCK